MFFETFNLQHCARTMNSDVQIKTIYMLECGPMPNMMAALPNIGGAFWSTLQSLADAQY